MIPVSIITPSLARDFEAARLLCDSMDRYAGGYDRHYVIVAARDMKLFKPLAGRRREIVDERDVLPRGLVTLPFPVRGRTYRWAPGIPPIRGWHVQQLIKFGMTLRQPNARVMFVDSDNCFVRPFDLAAFAGGPLVPLQHEPAAITEAGLTEHALWLRNAHALLGLASPAMPADDYIGNMIVWDAAIVRDIVARIEAVSQTSWWRALCRRREFSEYLIYGAAVASDPELVARHRPVTQSPSLGYWSGPPLDEAGLDRLIERLAPQQAAIGVQSFIGTPVGLIRKAALHPRAFA
ncbi:MAG: DUF6492 family protein [Devosia sp.]